MSKDLAQNLCILITEAAGVDIFAAVGKAFQVGGTNRATGVGTQSQIVLLPDGRFEMDIGSFAGASSQKIYGCDGVNRGFEFDGTTFVPIKTGMPTDKPNHVVVHKKHLFFSFGASVQFSGLGLPYQFTVLTGGGEIVLDADVSSFLTQPGNQSGGALAISVADQVVMLQYAIYSVISPEGCASILWKTSDKAQEAAELRLVSKVVPFEELETEALKIAQTIAKNSEYGVWMTKKTLRSNLDASSLRQALELENRTQVLGTFTGGMSDAREAFAKGQSPVWKPL